MSFLPHNNGLSASWVAAACGSAVVHGAVFWAAIGLWSTMDHWTPDEDPNDTFSITLEQLDTEALIGTVSETNVVAPDPDDPENTPETMAGQPTETPNLPDETATTENPLNPENTAETEPETTPETTPEPETDPQTDPETDPQTAVNTVAPSTDPEMPTDPIESQPEDPIAADPLANDPLPADPLANAPIDETIPILPTQPTPPVVAVENPFPVVVPSASTTIPGPANGAGTVDGQPEGDPQSQEPDRLAVLLPDPPEPDLLEPGSGQPETGQPDTPLPSIVRPAPPDARDPLPAQQQPPRAPTPQDLALSNLIERIQTLQAAACVVALPRRDGAEAAGLALMGADGAQMRAFSSQVLADWPQEVRQTQVLIDPRQCPALTYVQNNSTYPASPLGIRLDSTEVPSGGRLSGIIRGIGGKSALLLIIDANGVVQSLERFITVNGDFARFEVPVTRTGNQRDAAQILLALATPEPATIIQERLGQLAQDVFAGLDANPISDAAMAITTFNVR